MSVLTKKAGPTVLGACVGPGEGRGLGAGVTCVVGRGVMATTAAVGCCEYQCRGPKETCVIQCQLFQSI